MHQSAQFRVYDFRHDLCLFVWRALPSCHAARCLAAEPKPEADEGCSPVLCFSSNVECGYHAFWIEVYLHRRTIRAYRSSRIEEQFPHCGSRIASFGGGGMSPYLSTQHTHACFSKRDDGVACCMHDRRVCIAAVPSSRKNVSSLECLSWVVESTPPLFRRREATYQPRWPSLKLRLTWLVFCCLRR